MNTETAPLSSGKRAMGWMPPVLIISLVMILGLGYGFYSTRNTLEERIATLEQALDTTNQDIVKVRAASDQQKTELAAGIQAVENRVGITATDLQKARTQIAQRMKAQQDEYGEAQQKITSQLATKAESTAVDTLRQESTTKLA